MYRRGAEVYLRIDLRVLEGISNHRRSCRVLRPVQEQCQQCIVAQTYPSARKAEEKSVLQLRLLPEDCSEVVASFILTTPLILLNNEGHPKNGVPLNLININEVWSPFTGGFVPRTGREKFSKERAAIMQESALMTTILQISASLRLCGRGWIEHHLRV